MSNSLQTHGSKHTRLPCPSLSPGVCSNSCQWKPPNHLILCCPLPLLPSIFPSIRVFSNESALHIRWRKYWSFSFSISPFSEYSGLISRHKRPHSVWLHFCEMFKIGIPIETQSRLAVSRGWGKGGMRNDCYCIWNFLRGWGNVLEFDSSDGCTTLWIYQEPLNCIH